jgi:hypothetical protein
MSTSWSIGEMRTEFFDGINGIMELTEGKMGSGSHGGRGNVQRSNVRLFLFLLVVSIVIRANFRLHFPPVKNSVIPFIPSNFSFRKLV